MWRMTATALVALMPVAAFAEDAVIRIEAKRGQAAAEAAAEIWRQSYDNVVTFPLPSGWFGIALGPMEAEQAEATLTELKAAGEIPGDSFVSVLAGDVDLQPVGQTAPITETITPSLPEPAIIEQPSSYIRLQSFQDRAKSDQALSDWRKDFPAAGMWELPTGWFTIALGPLEAETADAWLEAFKRAESVPKDAFISDIAEIGQVVSPGKSPDLPAPGQPEEMPPMTDVQRALQWAGLYDGEIDGNLGQKTLAAMNAEITGQRFSPDPGTAMRNLLDRRAEWRNQFGLTELKDEHSGLSLFAPMNVLQFDRAERALSIYGPKADSGAALILFSQDGGQQELVDLSGLVTALGWVPNPERVIERDHIMLTGKNEHFTGHAEGWVRDGRADGFVLIWPTDDGLNRHRLIAEMRDSLKRFSPAKNSEGTPSVVNTTADEATAQE